MSIHPLIIPMKQFTIISCFCALVHIKNKKRTVCRTHQFPFMYLSYTFRLSPFFLFSLAPVRYYDPGKQDQADHRQYHSGHNIRCTISECDRMPALF